MQEVSNLAGTGRIPDNEDEIAADLYVALQDFFKAHPHLSSRPFFISGESYAGKYIPAIGKYFLSYHKELYSGSQLYLCTMADYMTLQTIIISIMCIRWNGFLQNHLIICICGSFSSSARRALHPEGGGNQWAEAHASSSKSH